MTSDAFEATASELGLQLAASFGLAALMIVIHSVGLIEMSRRLHLREEELRDRKFDYSAVMLMVGLGSLLVTLHLIEIVIFAAFYLQVEALASLEFGALLLGQRLFDARRLDPLFRTGMADGRRDRGGDGLHSHRLVDGVHGQHRESSARLSRRREPAWLSRRREPARLSSRRANQASAAALFPSMYSATAKIIAAKMPVNAPRR